MPSKQLARQFTPHTDQCISSAKLWINGYCCGNKPEQIRLKINQLPGPDCAPTGSSANRWTWTWIAFSLVHKNAFVGKSDEQGGLLSRNEFDECDVVSTISIFYILSEASVVVIVRIDQFSKSYTRARTIAQWIWREAKNSYTAAGYSKPWFRRSHNETKGHLFLLCFYFFSVVWEWMARRVRDGAGTHSLIYTLALALALVPAT